MNYLENLIAIKKRNKKIISLREKGWTYKKLAQKYGISKQRIFAIVSQNKELSTDESK